jgi:oligoendopeptidase F
MAKELLKRSEQKVEDTWDLSDIYATTADFDKDVENLKALADKAAGFKGRMFENAKTFLECMKTWEAMNMTLYKAFEYAQRLSDQDTKNTENLARLGKLEAIEVEIGSKTAFFDPELIAGDDETLKKYYEEEPELKEFEIYINNSRRLKPHMLSEELENLMALAGEVRSNPQNIFSLFNNADLVFPEIEDENGEKVRISHGRFIPLMESSNRRVRKDAFEALYSTYEQFQNSIAAMYQGQVKQLIFNAKARHYNSILEAALNVTNVDTKVYKNLIEAVNENMDKMYKYVALRKKILGVDELHMYDVYTPIVKDVSVDIPFEQAKETVLKALAPLGERYISLLKEGFENRWIDVYENEGKRSGAYSAGVYGVHPYVLLNYNNTLDNQFTLAHEMGHSLHSYFTDEAQNFFNSHYKIFVAEVASTVNEVLLMEYLLKVTTDKNQKAYLLNHYLDSFKGTVYRQTMFAEFEMLTAELAEKGESLNAETLRKTYYELNKKYFGPDMVSDELISMEWARIPHFYYNFYVFQYATGYSAAVAIARRILKEGQPAVDDYMKFLHSGCTSDPVSLLKLAGVDMSTKAPIESALNVFGEIIDEMSALMSE